MMGRDERLASKKKLQPARRLQARRLPARRLQQARSGATSRHQGSQEEEEKGQEEEEETASLPAAREVA